jgi:signal transduction histidine kinase
MIGVRETSLIFTATTILGLGIYVASASPGREVNRVFALFCIFACVWCFGILMVRLSVNRPQALAWGKIPFFGGALAVYFFLRFSLVFPEGTAPKWISTPLFLLIPSLAFALLSFTSLILKDVQVQPWGYDSVHGPLHRPYIIYLFLYLVTGIVYLVRKFLKTSSPIRRLQLKYVLLGLTVAPAITLTTNAILPAIWSAKFTDVGPSSFIILVVSTSYAIVKHRLMDIDLLIKKGSVLLFSMMILCFPVFILLVALQRLFYGTVNYEFIVFVIILVGSVSFAFAKIRTMAEEKIEKYIFRDRYRVHHTLIDFGRALISIVDLKALSKRVMSTVSEAMNATRVSFYLLDDEKMSFVLYGQISVEDKRRMIRRIPQNDMLFQRLVEEKTVLVKEELLIMPDKPKRDHILNRLDGMQSEVCVPLISRKGVIGIVNLGQKRNRRPYTIQDFDLLTTVANQTVIAIENAKLYEDLKKQKAVMRRADRLASLGTLTAGLAHEIRNPLVAIKTLTQLLPERLDDEEFRKDFLKIASGEVDRISSLVNELLEFARPTSPQLQLENIQDTMDGMILLISTETKKKSVEIVTHYEDNLPLVAADREQVKQVFLNVLLNAIEATSDGGQVSVEIRTFAKKSGEEFLQVEIRDTGRGIPEEHLENVFTPFFTTKDKGSGLGLSISHQIIQEHGGTISVESRINEGSSFFINFPVSGKARGDLVADGVEKEAAHSIQ